MRLVDWAREFGQGAYTELHHRSRVSYKTVLKAARDGRPISRIAVAEALSAATEGRCSVEEICWPDGRPTSDHAPAACQPGAVDAAG